MADAVPAVARGIRIGPATLAQLPAVHEMERACFSDPWPSHAFHDALASDARRMYFATACDTAPGARVLGYVIAWYVLDEGEIGNVAVAPDARRMGVGAALLDAALAEARRRGVRVMHLEVRESNAAARALYATRGFEEVGRRRGYYRQPAEDAILLRRVEAEPSAGPPPAVE